MINGTQEERHAEQLIQDRLMMSIERGFALKIYRLLNKYANKVANTVKHSGRGTNIAFATDGLRGQLEELFLSQYEKAFGLFSKRVTNALKSSGIELEQKVDTFSAETRVWMLNMAGEKSKLVTETTNNIIQQAMVQGFDAMLPVSEISKLIIAKAGGQVAKSRAIMIARTETHMAAMNGSLQAANDSGVAKLKYWIDADDERARPDHKAAGVQYADGIPIEDLFNIGGDLMRAPGGGSDPAQNIFCRCALGYLT